ncbi:putative two-component system sensor kinase [Actinoplanes friuliensis DSM 7358]|uniref:histidine kinase n=1 Tax=Actinoplanes friuliensis DSM 7358 TaxID=1246995 RepID=U5WAH2_9ACTN|nr:putative two-component system sensor kinase [Actinoplanes friuliensis DSM 7358]
MEAVPQSLPWVAATLTLVGVPAGLAITGGNVQGVMTACLAIALALLMFAVRRWPLTVLVVSVLSVIAFRTSVLIGTGWAWPATAAFVALALAGRIRTAVVAGAITIAYGFVWDWVVEQKSTDWVLGHVGGETLFLAAVIAAAVAYRNTRRWQDEVAARLQQSLHEQELEALRRRAEERVGIARDLHDVVSHTLAVVGVHLNVALDAFDDEPGEARDALRLAQDVRGRAMTDLKSLVDVLREGDRIATPAAGLEGLAGLADQVRAAGVDVTVTELGDRSEVPAPVATAVYRVVQESLTNTVRHAGATRVAVSLHYTAVNVTVEVTDDGGGKTTTTEGHGIMGMRERVAALGGALTAGPGPGGGFTVRALIPIAA